MKRKVITALVAASMCATLVAGCGQTSSTADKGQATEETKEEKNSNKTVSLTLWGDEADVPMLEKMVASFQEEYKSEAKFKIEIVPTAESECRKNLLADLEGGPDVFSFVDDQLMAMVAAGAIEPIEDAEKVKSDCLEKAVEASTINGNIYCYPMTADNGYFMYYDKSVFSDEDIKTLDGMLAAAATKEKKVTMDWTSGWYLYSFFGNTGLDVGLNDDGISNYCTFNSTEGAIKGVDVANALMAIAGNPGFMDAGDDAMIEGMKNGTVAAGVSGTWLAEKVEKIFGKNYGAAPLPTYTCAGKQVQMSSFSGYKLVGVNAYSKNKTWAEKLAQWITSEENQELRFAERGHGPANKKAAESEAVAKSKAIQALLAQSENAKLQKIGARYWDPMTAFGQAMANRNTGNLQLQEYMDQMVEKITAAY